jgi:lipoprotein-anchoring transpeptidase ErfK/SrfK
MAFWGSLFMRLRPARPDSSRLRRVAAVTACVAMAAAPLAGCTSGAGSASDDASPGSAASPSESEPPPVSQVVLSTNLPQTAAATVPVNTLVKVRAQGGTLTKVTVTGPKQRIVHGGLSADRRAWTATERLEPGTRYVVRTVGTDTEGLRKPMRQVFRTDDLSLDEQTYPSVAPIDGDTVGVGMPVILRFDLPVTHKAVFEKNLSVTTAPAQPGSWHWMSDNEVHWRPKSYWRPGTKVTVRADVNSLDAGNGIYGQEDRVSRFTVGNDVRMKIDVGSHSMQVTQNGQLLRTIPISAGKPGFTTRSGVKVIVEKFRTKRMDAATTGISENDPEYYDIDNVEYAQRVTYSGEFLHAAPWSVGYQGSANVSHGCVGMSTDNAAWLYSLTKVGDVVEVTGSDRYMTIDNGYGDWNVPFAEYKQGSALS